LDSNKLVLDRQREREEEKEEETCVFLLLVEKQKNITKQKRTNLKTSFVY